ncbi:MAG: hypothetical protein SNG14_08805 [Rikenellaceae bacterium]
MVNNTTSSMATNDPSQQDVIKAVEGHVEQLIADHKRLTERNRDLSEQCDKLKRTKRELQERVVALERELATLSLATGIAASESLSDRSRQRARAYVNRLLREIDECIALVTSPEGAGDGE